MAKTIERDHLTVLRENIDDTASAHESADCENPCRSTTGGPEPSVRYLMR